MGVGHRLKEGQRGSFFFQAEDGIRDWPVTGVQTCALPIYHQPEPDQPLLGQPLQHQLVEADRPADPAAVALQADVDQHPLLQPVVPVQEAAQGAAQVVHVDLREEPQSAQVDPQHRHVALDRQPRGGQQRAVAAQRDQQPDGPGQGGPSLAGGLPDGDGGVLEHPPGGDETRDVGVDVGMAEEGDHDAAGRRWSKSSRLPPAPGSADHVWPSTASPWPAHQSRNRASAAATAAWSRTMPPFPTSARPTWNCGLKRTTSSAPGAAAQMAGRTVSSPMNETSTVTSETGSGNDCRLRALTRSIGTTRGFWRRLQCRSPRPTSTAYTRSAPRCRSTSVKPPVDAPTSAQTRPATLTPNSSRAGASFSPPRLT